MTKGRAFLLFVGVSTLIGLPLCIVGYREAIDIAKQHSYQGFAWSAPSTAPAAPRFTFVESPICGGRIMVERHPNDDFKSFHVTATLTTDDYADYEDLLIADDSPNIELVRGLCEVNGVGKVMLRPREIIIEKGPAFTWDEVQPGVVEAIGFHLGPCPSAEK